MPRSIIALGLIICAGCIGCANNEQLARDASLPLTEGSTVAGVESSKAAIRPASHNGLVALRADQERIAPATLTLDDHQYTLSSASTPIKSSDVVDPEIPLAAEQNRHLVSNPAQPAETDSVTFDGALFDDEPGVIEHGTIEQGGVVSLNLPSALARIDSQHPAVGLAQWKVQEAYAQLASAKVLWLPSIQAGFSFHRHDGNYQASDGSVVDINRNSFQYGLGAGATGAGTTPRPGLVAQFHLADAIFQPKIAEKSAWARRHATNAVVNKQLHAAANAYIELLDAHQDAQIIQESNAHIAGLSKITSDFATAGQGLQADADRMMTEMTLIMNRLVGARERVSLASTQLAQVLSIDGGSQIVPTDVTVVPLNLVSLSTDKASMVRSALAGRPELKESQTLVAAACDAHKRQKYAPFVPSVLLGFSTGEFGGGLGNKLENIDGRYDFDAMMTWQVRNLGFGERAARRESSARIQQAKFEAVRVMDQIAAEVSQAYVQVQFRQQQMHLTQQAIESAEDSYDHNLSRIRDGQGLPLEVLQSVQALETARRAYLRAVIDHNQAQFRLQWALGWPVSMGTETTTSR